MKINPKVTDNRMTEAASFNSTTQKYTQDFFFRLYRFEFSMLMAVVETELIFCCCLNSSLISRVSQKIFIQNEKPPILKL